MHLLGILLVFYTEPTHLWREGLLSPCAIWVRPLTSQLPPSPSLLLWGAPNNLGQSSKLHTKWTLGYGKFSLTWAKVKRIFRTRFIYIPQIRHLGLCGLVGLVFLISCFFKPTFVGWVCLKISCKALNKLCWAKTGLHLLFSSFQGTFLHHKCTVMEQWGEKKKGNESELVISKLLNVKLLCKTCEPQRLLKVWGTSSVWVCWGLGVV